MDRFSTKFLKKAADMLAYTSFAKIRNLLVKLCVSPEECKIATLKTVLERLKDRLYFCLQRPKFLRNQYNISKKIIFKIWPTLKILIIF